LDPRPLARVEVHDTGRRLPERGAGGPQRGAAVDGKVLWFELVV
jgi:hypothetical protein